MKFVRRIVSRLFLAVMTLGVYPAVSGAMTSRAGSAQDFGVGATLGQPLGLTGKYWTSATTAIDFFAGYHFNSNFDIHADYLWHTFSSFNVSQGRLPFYVGIGPRLHLGNDTHLGARFPLGLAYLAPSDPMEFFVEIAPVVKILGGLDAGLDGVIGFRLYLNYLK